MVGEPATLEDLLELQDRLVQLFLEKPLGRDVPEYLGNA